MSSHYFWLVFTSFWSGMLSFGGLAAVLATLRRDMVDNHHLLTDAQFTGLYGLAVAAPGPNAVFLGLVGYAVAGPGGALGALVGWFLPSMLFLHLAAFTSGSRALPEVKRARSSLVPVVGGLLVAGSFASAATYSLPQRQWALTAVAVGALLARPGANPVWVVLACGVLGAFLLQPPG